LSNRIFESYTDIVDACCAAWNAIVSEPKRIASIAITRLGVGQSLMPLVITQQEGDRGPPCATAGTTSSLAESAGLERARSISAWVKDYAIVLDLQRKLHRQE
jgi:hypothetical protein